jgi:lipocalin
MSTGTTLKDTHVARIGIYLYVLATGKAGKYQVCLARCTGTRWLDAILLETAKCSSISLGQRTTTLLLSVFCLKMKRFSSVVVLVQVWCCSVQLALGQCPPSGFNAVETFDLQKYDGSWHTIAQLPVSYQPKDQLNCVYVNYVIDESGSLRCRLLGCTDPVSFSVFNSARDGSTTGRAVTVSFKGTVRNFAAEPAKVFVGPNFIPNALRRDSNYWVVAVGQYKELAGLESEPSSDQYEWAIVTSATPTATGKPLNGTTATCYSPEGFWYFSRQPVPPAGTLQAMNAIATMLKLDTSVLEPVNHTGCDYVTERRRLFSGFFLFEFLGRFF